MTKTSHINALACHLLSKLIKLRASTCSVNSGLRHKTKHSQSQMIESPRSTCIFIKRGINRFNTEVNAPWKIIPNYMTRHLGGFKFLLSCSYKTKELSLKNIPYFYSEILNRWEMIKKIKAEIDQEKIDLYDVIIWNNHEIKIANKPMSLGTRQVLQKLNTS